MLCPPIVTASSSCGEVRAPTSRLMPLGEEHFLPRPFRRSPALHSSLQRPQLAIGKSPGITSLQRLEDRLRLQARVRLQQALFVFPDLRKGIFSGSPPFPGFDSLGARPSRRYLRAVFTSIPALAAAVSRLPSTFPKANNLLTCLSVTKF